MKVKAYCGRTLWITLFSEHDRECAWEETLEVDADEWEEGAVEIKCSNCGATLRQNYDLFEVKE